jgi:hypothetical protein
MGPEDTLIKKGEVRMRMARTRIDSGIPMITIVGNKISATAGGPLIIRASSLQHIQ